MPSEANDSGDDGLRRLDENLFETVADLLERPDHHERMAGARAPATASAMSTWRLLFLGAEREREREAEAEEEGGGGRWLARFRGRCVWGREREGRGSRTAGRRRLLLVVVASWVAGGGWFLGLPPRQAWKTATFPACSASLFLSCAAAKYKSRTSR